MPRDLRDYIQSNQIPPTPQGVQHIADALGARVTGPEGNRIVFPDGSEIKVVWHMAEQDDTTMWGWDPVGAGEGVTAMRFPEEMRPTTGAEPDADYGDGTFEVQFPWGSTRARPDPESGLFQLIESRGGAVFNPQTEIVLVDVSGNVVLHERLSELR